jgi:hypothetical protein
VKHVVNFSGGLCSFWAAKRVAERFGTSDMVLLFADTLIEDPDLYIFNEQCARHLGVPITRVSREMTPWELFRKEGMIGNDRAPICSIRLKREVLDEWMGQHFMEMAMNAIMYIGFDWTEQHRLDSMRKEKPFWKIEAPMIDEPVWDKCRMRLETERLGILIPLLYLQDFPHNNCGGACVRAGISHWVHLLKVRPATYAEWERQEELTNLEFQARGKCKPGQTFSILQDRRGGKRRPLSLKEVRARVAAGEEFDRHDWGGCGCGAQYDQPDPAPLLSFQL